MQIPTTKNNLYQALLVHLASDDSPYPDNKLIGKLYVQYILLSDALPKES
jgi:hypothetical protein